MEVDSRLADKIKTGEFIFTAEYLPPASTQALPADQARTLFNSALTAVNVADNPYGPVLSSLAGSVALQGAGVEPIFQLVTRDRNRIAIQSDLMGAYALGLRNLLCLSGYHQALTRCPESANVYDLDAIQLIAAVSRMNKTGTLLDGTPIAGNFRFLVGAVTNPDLEPVELNLLRLSKKVAAGAAFIQTQAVFEPERFGLWLAAVQQAGIADHTAIIAAVRPLESAAEARQLREKYTDFIRLDPVIDRLEQAGDAEAQQQEGLALFTETVHRLRKMAGLGGIHILSGGKETLLPELMTVCCG